MPLDKSLFSETLPLIALRQQDRLMTRVQQEGCADPPDRATHKEPRLDRLLFWVVGTIAVRCGGALTTGGGKVSLLGRYISREQIRMLGKG